MNYIDPISNEQQTCVTRQAQHYLARAAVLFDTHFETIPILFDLKGRSAGMYRVKNKVACIRFNPYLFSKYFDDNLRNTVPHEIAHYVTDVIYGLGNIRPHGKEWRYVMDKLGTEPRVTADYNLTGIPQRQSRTFRYHCACTEHSLGIRRHKKIVTGRARYYCKTCKNQLSPAIVSD